MPFYEYKCGKCGGIFELRARMGEVPAEHPCTYEGCDGIGEKVFSTFGVGHGGAGYDGDNVLIPCREITKQLPPGLKDTAEAMNVGVYEGSAFLCKDSQLPPHIRKVIDRLRVMRKAVRDSEAHPGEN